MVVLEQVLSNIEMLTHYDRQLHHSKGVKITQDSHHPWVVKWAKIHITLG